MISEISTMYSEDHMHGRLLPLLSKRPGIMFIKRWKGEASELTLTMSAFW